MVFMYMKDPAEEFDWFKVTPSLAACICLSVAGVLIPGMFPGYILQWAQQAVLPILQ
jgi:NADH-quinone oxidoreductase subunit N